MGEHVGNKQGQHRNRQIGTDSSTPRLGFTVAAEQVVVNAMLPGNQGKKDHHDPVRDTEDRCKAHRTGQGQFDQDRINQRRRTLSRTVIMFNLTDETGGRAFEPTCEISQSHHDTDRHDFPELVHITGQCCSDDRCHQQQHGRLERHKDRMPGALIRQLVDQPEQYDQDTDPEQVKASRSFLGMQQKRGQDKLGRRVELQPQEHSGP